MQTTRRAAYRYDRHNDPFPDRRETHPYKGYLIKRNPIGERIWIEKSGQFIGWCSSVDIGKEIIDSLTGD